MKVVKADEQGLKTAALKILTDAQALEAAGAFGVLLENIPAEVAKTIAEQTSFLTFSIGGGPDTAV